MNKIVNLGKSSYGQVFCHIKIKDGKLSITGVEGPIRNGNYRGSCGQIYSDKLLEDITPGSDWSHTAIKKFFKVWEDWHLNDMRAGCIHQRKNWNLYQELEIPIYGYSNKFYNMLTSAKNGKLSIEEYTYYKEVVPLVDKIVIKKHTANSELIEKLLAIDCIKLKKTEIKKANWVHPYEHKDGILTKQCEVCGYSYGSAWLKETLPQEIIDYLRGLPETTLTPAWV